MQYKNQNYDYNEPRVSNKPVVQPQSSPRNLSSSMKSAGNQMNSQHYSLSTNSGNGANNGMVFSFQAPPKGYTQPMPDGITQYPPYNYGYQPQPINRNQHSPIVPMQNYHPQNYGQPQYQSHYYNDYNPVNRQMYQTQILQQPV